MPEAPLEKKCSGCDTVKVAADFGIDRGRYDGLQCHCRICKRSIQNAWYQKNKARHILNVGRTRKERVARLRGRVQSYLLEHPCVGCGESELLLLDFDHVRGIKRMHVSEMVSACLAWETIITEIAKCDVRCVKCHRRKTAKQLGWYAS